jgi:hypothetical protein
MGQVLSRTVVLSYEPHPLEQVVGMH